MAKGDIHKMISLVKILMIDVTIDLKFNMEEDDLEPLWKTL